MDYCTCHIIPLQLTQNKQTRKEQNTEKPQQGENVVLFFFSFFLLFLCVKSIFTVCNLIIHKDKGTS